MDEWRFDSERECTTRARTGAMQDQIVSISVGGGTVHVEAEVLRDDGSVDMYTCAVIPVSVLRRLLDGRGEA